MKKRFVDRRLIKPVLIAAHLLFLSMLLQNCASIMGFPTYFDFTTYKNLTYLKPEILMLYDSFATDQPDSEGVRAIRLKLGQMIEYEKGKGLQNAETARQCELINGMFERHVKDRMESGGPWSEEDLANSKENISEAFDIAISTENLKNKNE